MPKLSSVYLILLAKLHGVSVWVPSSTHLWNQIATYPPNSSFKMFLLKIVDNYILSIWNIENPTEGFMCVCVLRVCLGCKNHKINQCQEMGFGHAQVPQDPVALSRALCVGINNYAISKPPHLFSFAISLSNALNLSLFASFLSSFWMGIFKSGWLCNDKIYDE